MSGAAQRPTRARSRGPVWAAAMALAGLAASACDAPPAAPITNAGADAATDVVADAAGRDMADGAPAPGSWAGMAVVCSDYSSTSVALVDAAGRAVTTPTLIDSGSLPPGVLPALGGDVDLPTTPPPDGSVLLLDRTPSGVLTFVDPASGAVRRQLAVGGGVAGGPGFAANPHDALVAGQGGAGGRDALTSAGLAPGSVLVTRYEPNPLAPPPAGDAAGEATPPLDAGDDLLLAGTDGAALAALRFTEADGFPGRPDRLLPVGPGTVWVSLNRVSRDWQTYREGAIAVVEVSGDPPALRAKTRLAIPGATNCGALAAAPGEAGADLGGSGTRRVAVACGGAWQVGTSSFAVGESAVVLWEVGDEGAGVEVARLEASSLPDTSAGRTFGPGLAVLPGGAVVATAYAAGGDASGDAAIWWDPATGQMRTLMTTTAPWTLWAAQATADGAVLLPVSDDLDPKLCRVTLGTAGPEVSCLAACASTGLPPRAVRPFGLWH